MPTLNTTQYVEYFEALATTLKDLAHNTDADVRSFFVEDDFFNAVSSSAKYPCLMVEYPSITPQDNDADNYRELQRGALTIWSMYESGGQAKEKHAAFDASKAVLQKILAKMSQDDADTSSVISNMFDIQALEPYQMMEMPEHNLAGWRVVFTLSAHLDLSYSSADWLTR